MGRGGIGGEETAEKNWVMVGWDGSVVLRVRLRDGGGWRRLRAAGLGGERDQFLYLSISECLSCCCAIPITYGLLIQ